MDLRGVATAAPNAGNGGTTETYSWVQTLQDLNVNVPLPPNTKSKQMDVIIKKKSIQVGLKGQPPIFQGELSEAVLVDDCFWSIGACVLEHRGWTV